MENNFHLVLKNSYFPHTNLNMVYRFKVCHEANVIKTIYSHLVQICWSVDIIKSKGHGKKFSQNLENNVHLRIIPMLSIIKIMYLGNQWLASFPFVGRFWSHELQTLILKTLNHINVVEILIDVECKILWKRNQCQISTF
jgi:hypothetical protein